jgi:serine/threonine protein phosphatase PrpC
MSQEKPQVSSNKESQHIATNASAQSDADRLIVVGAMQSHPGLERSLNEDAAAYVLPDLGDPFSHRGSLALVADGVSGHAAGEIASRLAAEIIRRTYYQTSGTVPEVLAVCFRAANQAIYERAQADSSCTGMATTCTVVAIRNGLAYLAHVGDSRAYILREGALRQISQDHSVVAELVRRGSITSSEAMHSPYRNLVFRALGSAPDLETLIWAEGLRLQLGDKIILCSDGLSDLVDNGKIAEAAETLAPLSACRTLIAAALEKGGRDNISVGVFAVQERSGAREAGGPTRTVNLRPPEGLLE